MEFFEFAIIFGSLILGIVLVAWAISFGYSYSCRIKNVYHYHEYKISQDYNRLWELINSGKHIIGIEPKYEDDGSIYRIHPYEIRAYTNYKGVHVISTIDDFLNDCSKERFIGYCQYKNIQFLDFIIEKEK